MYLTIEQNWIRIIQQ